MKVYCWENLEYDTHSFYILAESKEIAEERIRKYIKEDLDRDEDGDGIGDDDSYNFPEDYEYSEKDINEVFTSYYPG